MEEKVDKKEVGIEIKLKDGCISIENKSNNIIKIDSYGNIEIRNKNVDRKENKDNIKEYRPYILFNRNINLKKESNKELGFVKFAMTDDISTKDIEVLKLFIEDKLS